jgi:hypothetical protein
LIEQRAPGAATLLDVACDTGRHLSHLQRHYRVWIAATSAAASKSSSCSTSYTRSNRA